MKKKMKRLYNNNLLSIMENNEFVIAMRRGLLLCIPVIMIGSFCLVVTSFPIPAYQAWVSEVFGGWLYTFVLWIYNATMGSITLFVILAISYSYGCKADRDDLGFYMLTAIVSFVVFAAEDIDGITFDIFNNNWLFTGIIVTLASCYMFSKLFAISKRKFMGRYQTGVDMDFRNTVLVIIPAAIVILFFAVIKLVLVQGVGVDIQNLGSFFMMELFGVIGTGLFGSILFVFLIHILWFFGIHGSNMLSMVSEQLFESGMLDNMAAVANGGEATHIFTKTFFDVFVLIGGSGATICLLLALLIWKGRKNNTLFKVSILPAIFNINEMVLFGLPVIFNPIMVIPFVCVPLVLLAICAISISLGLVPVPFNQVSWTTPILFSGYLSTGSIAGTILQMVSLAVGTAIYMPFIKMSEHYYDRLLQKNIQNLKEEMMECELKGEIVDLKTGSRSKRDIVKLLTKDLHTAIKNDEIMLYYQPQVSSDKTIYGVEALLRWKHPVAGFLYPPLVIELARQDDVLDELGIILIDKAARTLQELAKNVNKPMHLAVNISPVQFESDTFCSQVKKILDQYDFKECTLCFEITEQLALVTTEVISERIEQLKNWGIKLHMDDFGMGHSSMKYLQSNEFEAVKLDGSLVRGMMDNSRSINIISGIQNMALPLNYKLIAEYVETEQQREKLKDLGCDIYQGYLYSRPIPYDDLEIFLKENDAISYDLKED